ncbi:hypothetical protein [Mucilaginibacter defluvii]|uniref:Concanavalin A-like lectin/glucanase superfamily protein n=1 Tax=Mucilaginibacter defluvii TaxID=1196019 RepID=A0ABP9FSK0_9SPHI
MDIIYSNKNFASISVGFTSAIGEHVSGFETASQVSLPDLQRGALQLLKNDLDNGNVFSKGRALYPMVGSAASCHKLNFLNYLDNDAAYRITFSADSAAAHVDKGYKLAAASSRFGNTHYTLSGDINGFFAFAYITEPESAISSCILGARSNTPNSSLIFLSSHYNLASAGNALTGRLYDGVANTTVDGARSADAIRTTGLIGVSIIDGVVELYSNKAVVATVSNVPPPLVGGVTPVALGAYTHYQNGTSLFSDATIGSAGFFTDVTKSDVSVIIDAVIRFNQTLSR